MTKWAIELNDYDISYQPKTTIKAQALVKFVNEAMLVEEDDRKWLLHANNSSTLAGDEAGVVVTTPEGEELEYAFRFYLKA
ncbi:UNVERIFIED_CONTAM: hypothetical protein Slati_2763900 [Sesamum latifolium]|uniref:Uncharacterized protein n=1 Tax=Sesamum latifolium TaxID=2727402 RepID=A0AAW2W0P5_9LAMI